MKKTALLAAIVAVLLVTGFGFAGPVLAAKGSDSDRSGRGHESDDDREDEMAEDNIIALSPDNSGPGSLNSGPGSVNSNDDDGDDDEIDELPHTEVRAFTVGDTTQIKVEAEFMPSSTDMDAVLQEALDKLKALTNEQVSDMLRISEKDIDIRNDAELEMEGDAAEFELRFTTTATEKEAIVDAIMEKLGQLTLQDVKNMLEVDEPAENEAAGSVASERITIREHGDRIDIDARDGDNRIKIRADGTDNSDALAGLKGLLKDLLAAINSMLGM